MNTSEEEVKQMTADELVVGTRKGFKIYEILFGVLVGLFIVIMIRRYLLGG